MPDTSTSTRESYDEVAAAYVEHVYSELAQKPLDRHLLNRFAEELRGRGRIADLGCGPGHVTRYLREQAAEVLGVDLSPAMVRWARQLNPGISFHAGDFRSLGLRDGSLAGIVAFYSLIHVDPGGLVPALREFRRVLAPRGLLLVAFHRGEHRLHLDELWGHEVCLDFHFFLPSFMIACLQDSGFQVFESLEREPYEGAEYPSQRCYLLARGA